MPMTSSLSPRFLPSKGEEMFPKTEIYARTKGLYIIHSSAMHKHQQYENKQSFHQSSYFKMLQNLIRQEVSLVLRIFAFRGTFLAVTEQALAVFILEDASVSLIKPETFLSHRQRPELGVAHPRTVISLRFSN